VYPFLAVDPRRPDIITTVLSGKLVSHQGPFYGIKLYPRLGVHPQCADLLPLYAWCEAGRIPITTHADEIGFPPPGLQNIAHLDQSDLGHPRHFQRILEQFPNLVIDFAHFGMSNLEWAEQIATFIGDERFTGVYSDLACYTTQQVIVDFRKRFWHRPRVAERTLLGTDYDVFYLVTLGITLERYLENFSDKHTKDGFTLAELEQMRTSNAIRFLGVSV
jgi:predicted TIM-barrel fold metal-dependent hydrolase